MTPRENDCYRLIRMRDEAGVPPTQDELRVALGLASKSGVNRLINSLERQNLVRRTGRYARNVIPVSQDPYSRDQLAKLTDGRLGELRDLAVSVLAERKGRAELMGLRGPAGSWTEERIALLTKHFHDGLSASQSARALGGVTRNAVIGKRTRLRLGFDRPAAPRPRPAPAPRVPPYRGGFGAPTAIKPPTPLKIAAVRDGGMDRSNRSAGVGLVKKIANGSVGAVSETPDDRPRAVLAGVESPNAKTWTERGARECVFPVSGEGAETMSCCNKVRTGTMCEAHRVACYHPAPKPPKAPHEYTVLRGRAAGARAA